MRRIALGVSVGVAVLLVAQPVGAQAKKAEPSLLCATLLTAAELEAAAGATFEKSEPLERGEGYSECSWTVRDGSRTVTLSFWEPRAMSGGMVSASSPEEYFEMIVKSAEDTHEVKRETLQDIGLQAAFVTHSDLRVVFLQTPKGVAHVLTAGVTKAQAVAVAKAVAAP
jgi:hypothetical protein